MMNNITKLISITSFILLFSLNTIAQIAINSDGSSSDASAMLDITSSDKGLLIPRMDSTSRKNISSPATGLLVYDTDFNSFWYYANSTWNNLSSAILADTDSDTKIQVEESSDEDIIRFDLGGTEFMRLNSGRIETPNTGYSVFLGEGAGANDDLSDNKNTFIGYNAGYSSTTGVFNVFQGYQSGYSNTTGASNVFQGYQSGYSNTTSSSNIFQGYQSGYSNTTGTSNVFQGYQSGYSNTTGSYNVFLGRRTGYSNTTGQSNVFIGNAAGDDNTTGEYNVFIGYSSGGKNVDGNENIFLGYSSGNENTTGEKNAFIGYLSGKENTTGSENTFIGNEAGLDNLTGENNTYLGYQTGLNNSTGVNNIYLGYQAGYSALDSNKLYIENSNSTSPLIYGDFENDLLQINGTLSITQGFTDTDSDTKIQVEESSDDDIIRFDLGGTEFMRLNSGRIETPNTGYSVFLGEGAGTNDDLSDNYNTFIGYNAGYSTTTGFANIFLGQYAGYKNTTSFTNIFIGGYAGYEITTGFDNIFLGRYTGRNTTNGIGNTFLGKSAGYSNTTGAYNVFLGYRAGYNETGSNKLYIENSNASSPLIYGEFDNDLLQINGTLNINGAFEFPTSDGSASEVLVTDGSGILSWSEIDNTIISDADADTKIQVEESSDEDIIRFDLGGTEQMQLNSSELDINGNIAFGTSNLFQLDEGSWKDANITLASGDGTFGMHSPSGSVDLYVDGSLNTRAGLTIGHSNTYTFPDSDGSANQVLATDGSGVLSWSDLDNTLLSDADADTKIQVEESNDEDIIRFDLGGTEYFKMENGRLDFLNNGQSVFIGTNAGLGDDFSTNVNVAIGYSALKTNTTGVGNMALGSESLTLTTSSFNTGIGAYSGEKLVSGSRNVFIGYSSGQNITTGGSNIMIGTDAGGSTDVSNRLFIDNSNTDSPLIWGDFSNDRVVINGNYTDNSNSRTFFVNGSIGATSAFNNDSDRRLKTDIQTIPNALDKVLEMRGVTYQWKDGREAGDRMGFIAQEVEPILPEVVDNKNDHYTMQYAPITAVLVEAVKELKHENEALKNQVNDLKSQVQKINELEAKLEALLNNQ